MFSSILGIAIVFLCFGFIIFIHELGHFLMARRVGIKVHEFALGFGPKIMSKEKDETVYALRLFPFGGFCAMEGEDGNDKGDPNDPGNFNNKTYWERIKVIASGPLMNYLAAILLFLFVGFIFGTGEMYMKPRIGKVMENTPASRAGLQQGDYIVALDGVVVEDAVWLVERIHNSLGKELALTIKRGEEHFDVTVTPVPMSEKGEQSKIGIIGFQPDQKALDMRFIRRSPGGIFLDTADKIARFTVSPFIAVAMIFQGKMKAKEVAEGSAGPVGIGQMFFEMYKKGFASLLYFIAIINVLIGVFNLIPFPALDGSRIAVMAYSGLTKKEVDPNKEGMVHWVGFMVLMILVVFFTYNDIVRLIKGVTFF